MNAPPAPDLTDLLTQLQAAPDDATRDWIILQLTLESLTPALRDAVWVAAIPYWFDAPFLATLLKSTPAQAATLYAQLQTVSIVDPYPDRGHTISERSRALLLSHLWNNDRDRYRDLNARAVAHCAAKDQEDYLWCIQTLYHCLSAAEPDAVQRFIDQGTKWYNTYAYDPLAVLLRTLLEPARAGRLTSYAIAWVHYLQALLDMVYDRYPEARASLQQAQQHVEDNKWLEACVLLSLGEAHRMLCDYSAARARFEEVLTLYQTIGDPNGEATALLYLGNVHRMLSDYSVARTRFEEAQTLCHTISNRKGEAEALRNLGDIHLRLTEYPTARACYEAALPLFLASNNPNGEATTYLGLADLEYTNANFPKAETLYQQALATYYTVGIPFNIALTLNRLGQAARAAGNVTQARVYYQQSLELYKRINSPETTKVQAILDNLPPETSNA